MLNKHASGVLLFWSDCVDRTGNQSVNAHFGENLAPQMREQLRSTIQGSGSSHMEIDGMICR
jgi:hypothetical protein